MDLPPSMMPFLSSNSAQPGLSPDDPLAYLFPSATAEADDNGVVKHTCPPSASMPPSSIPSAPITTTSLHSSLPTTCTSHTLPPLPSSSPVPQSQSHPQPQFQHPAHLESFIESSTPAHSVYNPLVSNRQVSYPHTLLATQGAHRPALSTSSFGTSLPIVSDRVYPTLNRRVHAGIATSMDAHPPGIISCQASPSCDPGHIYQRHSLPFAMVAQESPQVSSPIQTKDHNQLDSVRHPSLPSTNSANFSQADNTLASTPVDLQALSQEKPAVQCPQPAVDEVTSAPVGKRSCGPRYKRKIGRRNRSLEAMKAIAGNNAPDVALTDDELIEIGGMHESEESLSQSRELYGSLFIMKKTLAKFGYRVTAVHVDSLANDQAENAMLLPFDFVLRKNVKPQMEAEKGESNTDKNDSQVQELGGDDGDTGIEKEPAIEKPNSVKNLEKARDENSANSDKIEEQSSGILLSNPIQQVTRFSSGSNSIGSTKRKLGDEFDENIYSVQQALEDAGFPTGGEKTEANVVIEKYIGDSFLMDAGSVSNEHGERPRKRGKVSKNGESSNGGNSSDGGGKHKYCCVICCKMISDVDNLVRHFRHVHQEEKPFSCPRCKGFYSSEGTLWHHIRNVHSGTPRKYKCDHCDASYDSYGAKTRHEHGTHHSDKPEFVCQFKDCQRGFHYPAHLEAHAEEVHYGFRAFSCPRCERSFPSANGLTRHRREVHDRPRAYACSCSKAYSKRCHLKRHLQRVHKMSPERVEEEMKKQPHPGTLHMHPRAPPASAD